MNICTRTKYIILFLSAVMALVSCRKHNDVVAPEVTTQLIVSFNSAGVDINATDSMTVVFTNGTDTIRKKGIRGGSFYSVSLSGLKANTVYTALNKVYTSADTLGDLRMYRFTGSVNTQAGSTILGPTAKQYDSWKSCLYYHNTDYNITFAMAESPTDPYFELTLPPSLPYQNVFISRNIYKTISKVSNVVGFATANLKASDYKGYHTNTALFTTFSNNASATSYDAADFSLQLYNQVNNDYKILFTHTSTF